MNQKQLRNLFHELYSAKNEQQVDQVLQKHPNIFNNPKNWHPYDGNESNFGVVENQQSNPVAALVEKITNSIDAILMRKCYEAGIDPKSSKAPQSIPAARAKFFPKHKNWDLSKARQQQAKDIQIIADSLPKDTANTSLIIYDDGEGQHPDDFEDTFLSLLRGNKNEIHFVQGKYNMGGTGGIVFCGKKRYQLIASKRYDGTGKFGFTLVRSHPFTQVEEKAKKSTWYEYLRIKGKIPAFKITTLGLGLYKRKFKTGTIIKLYSYDTKGNRHIARDMNRSLNEFLYEPALPIYTIEQQKRYPNDKNLERELYGLKRRLEARKKEYLEKDGIFSQDITDPRIGEVKVTIYVFKTKSKGKTAKETVSTIQNEFFKNNMAVLFSLNGQVHGHYTSEFITRSLKFHLLKNHLLIHVDCTKMAYDFRKELFMASRDRLKDGEEGKYLRSVLRDKLKSGKLKQIHKRRRDSIFIDTTESDDLLRSFVDKLPLDENLHKLLDQLFQVNKKGDKLPAPTKPKPKKSSTQQKKEKPPFNPQRYPTFFNAQLKEKQGKLLTAVPLYGEKTITFLSDVENEYFDRVEDPGELQIALLGYTPNETTGGDKKGNIEEIKDVLAVERRSPDDGAIRIVLKPTDEVQVGDEIQVNADLTAPDQNFSVVFWAKITEPPPPPKKIKKEDEPAKPGLPLLELVYENAADDAPNRTTWAKFEEIGESMNYETVVYPLIGGDKDLLEIIYVNMDSNILKNYKAKKNLGMDEDALINNKYIATIYAHTLFLYAVNKEKNYEINNGDLTLAKYISELFTNHYGAFLLNFETNHLVDML